jgi:hypothetical protein
MTDAITIGVDLATDPDQTVRIKGKRVFQLRATQSVHAHWFEVDADCFVAAATASRILLKPVKGNDGNDVVTFTGPDLEGRSHIAYTFGQPEPTTAQRELFGRIGRLVKSAQRDPTLTLEQIAATLGKSLHTTHRMIELRNHASRQTEEPTT